MKYSSSELREMYLKFFEKKWHKIVPSSSLIPENDPTTLFTGSGMQPMITYLLGEPHPLWTRICDSQKSFRAWDIDDIWDNRHTTFFEMLWNWSFWDYFKKEQISWMFEFLVKEVWLNPEKLYISVYRWNEKIWIGKDSDAVNMWKEQFKNVWIDALDVDNAEVNWMQDGRIFYYPDKENWWSRAGVPDNMPVWEPGWPDSEMFWDFWADLKLHEKSKWKDEPCHPACDCWRFLEIWNNVFMQYMRTEKWFEELDNKNIDFGGGLERIAVALSDNPDVFMWDLFDWIRNKIEELTWKKYWENENETMAFRVIMDHLRAATFLIADWAVPSNKDQWYFTRRLIRRAIRFAKNLWVEGWFITKMAEEVILEYKNHYKDLNEKRDFIITEMENEEKQFLSTLEKWLKEFDKLIAWLEIAFERTGNKIDTIAWTKAFKLYDTFGFPVEMTIELAEERGYMIDLVWFEKAKKEHQEKSRAWAEQKFAWWLADDSEATTALHSATHILLEGLRKFLWEDVSQKWANITAERLRFDFTYPEKVTRDILDKIEDYVNDVISKSCEVKLETMDKQVAKDSWVTWSFWEKYPDIVKVYTFIDSNNNVYSRELCWGPHVENTCNMWKFKIKKEESSSRWVRRIKAVLEK